MREKIMKKSTKGLFAGGAAAVLLLGGAGSLAYWTDDAPVDGGSLTAGEISLGAVTCTGWKHVETDLAVAKIVPGDEVYNDCTTTLTLVGDHIGATLAIDPASMPAGSLADELDADVALQDSAGAPIAAVTAEGTTDVTAHITVTFGYAAATNNSQTGTAVLDGLTLSAVQTHENTPTAP